MVLEAILVVVTKPIRPFFIRLLSNHLDMSSYANFMLETNRMSELTYVVELR